MIRRSICALVAVLVLPGGHSPARAADAAVTTAAPPAPRRFALSLAAGSGGAPQGHLGLRFAFAHGRFEAAAGLGVFVGNNPRTEDAVGKSRTTLTHLVPSLGAHVVVLRRKKFELAPGLGLSVQPFTFQEETTRPSYDTVQWTWQKSSALRLDAELEARVPVSDSWFVSAVVGWGVIVSGIGDCSGSTAVFGFGCQQPPSPAYAPPTPIVSTVYGQLVAGRRF